jgi:sugar transferase (PEP-CTERM/EpsH1 system associated)
MTARPLRIAHVVPTLDVGGLENGLVNLVAALPEFAHAVVSMSPLGAFAQRLPRHVELVTLGKPAGAPMRLAMFRLLRVLRGLQPDLVHSRNWGAIEAVPAARLAGVRAVVHSEHGRELADPAGLNARRNRLRRLLTPLIDRVVTVSADLKAWLRQTVRLPEAKLLVIPNGVDTERFSPTRRLAGRKALQVSDETAVIGTVGRLNGVKDYPTLLTAFADAARRADHVELVFIGDGPQRAALEATAAALGVSGRVRFLGERQDVPELVPGLDVFVLPSIAEGMSNTLLEAMAAGRPVVATGVGGNPELVEDGVTGTIIPVRHPAALTKAIDGYLWDAGLRAAHGEAGRRRAITEFGLVSMVSRYRDLYRTLAVGTRAV